MSLIHWWPLNGDTKNYGTSGEQVTESGVTYTDGKLGQAMYEGKINFTAEQWQKTIGNTISIAMWIYTREDGTYSAGTPFFGYGGMTEPNNRKFTMFHYPAKTTLHCSWQNDDMSSGENPSTYLSLTYANFFEIGKWVHLCVVQDAETETVTVYRNGTQYSKINVSGLATMNFKSAAAAPIRNNIDYQHINDIRIYDHALSVAEVKEISKCLLVHYNFEQHENLFDVEKYLTSSCVRCTLTPYGKTGFTFTSTGTDPYVNNYSSSLNTTAASVIKFPVVEGQTYCVSWRHVSGEEFNKNILSYYTAANVCVGSSAYSGWSDVTSVGDWRYRKITIPTGYSITQISLRVGNGTLASGSSITVDNVMMTTYDGDRYEYYNTGKVIDNSGFGYDGTLYNRCYFTSDTAVGTCSLRTYGNTSGVAQSAASYIMADLGQNITPTAFTISMWAKVNAFGVQNSGVLSLNTNSNVEAYMASTFVQYDGNFRLNSSADNTQSSISSGIVTLGEWHHYAFTWDGALLTAYRDGELYDKAVAASFAVDPFRYIFLGLDRAGGLGRDSDVTFGEFKLYMTALKAEDIAHEAKSKTLISNKGDVETHEFIEDQDPPQITKSHLFNCSSINEGIDGYALLEYIESSGTQSLNTAYTWNSENTLIVADINPITVANGQTLFGNEEYYSSSGRYFSHIVYKNSNVFYYYLGTGSGSTFNITLGERQMFESFTKGAKACLRSNGVVLEERSYSGYVQSGKYSSSTDSTKGYIHIFSNYNTGRGGVLQQTTKMRMYRFTMYDDGVMVRDIIPCKRISDGAVGAYDLVTESFLPNAGTGTFIAGPVLSVGEQATINKNKNISGRNLIEI